MLDRQVKLHVRFGDPAISIVGRVLSPLLDSKNVTESISTLLIRLGLKQPIARSFSLLFGFVLPVELAAVDLFDKRPTHTQSLAPRAVFSGPKARNGRHP
jgi:hypothetical protein